MNIDNWISVKDRLPDHDEDGFSNDVIVLVRCLAGKPYKDLEGAYVGFHILSDDMNTWVTRQHNMVHGATVDKPFVVTHWMPIPKNPK